MNEMRAFFQARTFLSNLLQTIIIIVLTGLLAYGMEQYNLMLEDMKLLYLHPADREFWLDTVLHCHVRGF